MFSHEKSLQDPEVMKENQHYLNTTYMAQLSGFLSVSQGNMMASEPNIYEK